MLAEAVEPSVAGLITNTIGAVAVTIIFGLYLWQRLKHDTEREKRQESLMIAVAAQVSKGEEACRLHNEKIAAQFSETVQTVLRLARGRE